MRCDRFVEEKCILNLARIANNTIISNDHIFANVGIVADFAVPADYRRTFYHCAIFDNCALADKNSLANEGHPVTAVFQSWPQIRRQISRDFLQCIPRIFASVKNARMLGLAQIEQIRRFEHGVKLGKTASNPKPKWRAAIRGPEYSAKNEKVVRISERTAA